MRIRANVGFRMPKPQSSRRFAGLIKCSMKGRRAVSLHRERETYYAAYSSAGIYADSLRAVRVWVAVP
jgi:hypothetical protein